MDSHPIPKNLMDVEFKLFGSLTVNQFGSLALSFLFALIVHLIKLPSIIGLPLKIGFILLGLALAFFKVNDLTFDKFLTYFVVSMLVPQRMIWKKENKLPESLTVTFDVPKVEKKNKRVDLVADVINDFTAREIFDAKADDENEKKAMLNIDKYFDDLSKNSLKNYKPSSK